VVEPAPADVDQAVGHRFLGLLGMLEPPVG
jgi:hypothetical protein